jgi:ribonucleoside-diphosphate reductase alpha chain
LHHPRTGESTGTLSAADVSARIAGAAWQTGDPGLVFLDAIARANPTPELGPIEATNPCGEVPLLPYEACNLGSLNLSRMVRREGDGHAVDWEKLDQRTRLAIRFLDDVIEVGGWPSPRIGAATRASRKIGLGVMGFAELLMLLEVPYGSERAVQVAEDVMRFISERALAASRLLADERGVFPNWQRSVYAQGETRVRNATRTSIAPTGTISIIAGTSAGIEPLFALAYRRQNVLEGETLAEWNPLFLRFARDHGLDSPELLTRLAREGSLGAVTGVAESVRELFRTALEIAPEDHLRIQAAFQKHVDNAVSKTVNLPWAATEEQIREIYQRAWQLRLKGITVFRYGSKDQQVLELGTDETLEEHEHFARCDPHACKL